MQKEVEELKSDIKEINKKLSSLNRKKEELTGKKSRLDALTSQIKSERIRLEEVTKQFERINSDLRRAESARKIVNELAPVEEMYKKENVTLKELNGDRLKRDKLKEDITKLDLKINSFTEKLKCSSKLTLENKELEGKKKQLTPKIEAAHKLEESIGKLQKELKEPMNDIISRLLNLREKSKRIEDIRRDIEEQKTRISHLLPLKIKQSELEARIKDRKDSLEVPLRELSSAIPVLKEKEARAEKLRSEISHLVSRKNQLLPAVKRQKVLEDEMKSLSSFLDSLGKLGFELRQATEKEQRANALLVEIEQLGNKIAALLPLVEQQTMLEARQQELNQKHAAVSSLLKQTRSNMKLAGTQGLCPILNGIKCTSVSDFTRYFNDEIESREKELTEIKSQLDLISKESKQLNNPIKQRDDMLVLITAKKKEFGAYNGVYIEVISCRSRIEALVSSYPSLGIDILTGNEDEQKAVSLKLQSHKKELEKTQKSVTEFESAEALITSKNKDLEDLSSVPAALAECGEKIKELNSRFGLSAEIDGVKAALEKVMLEISSLGASLKEMNDPSGQVATIESLVASKQGDLTSLKEVPAMISACLKKLEELNKKYNLKDALEGNPAELKLVDELIESKTRELKALNSPDKEFENLNDIIGKNLKDLKALEHVPASLESCRHERDAIAAGFLLTFDGLDEKIASAQDNITKLEPEHNKYLQALPLASKASEYAQECGKLKENISSINSALNEALRKYEELSREFSEPLLNDTISQLEELGKTVSSKAEATKGKNKSLEKLVREIAGMESEITKINEIEKKLENEKQFLSFSNFIRDTIKNSSEFIANEFIGEISQEAGNIYSEIMDDYTCGLKWQMITISRSNPAEK